MILKPVSFGYGIGQLSRARETHMRDLAELKGVRFVVVRLPGPRHPAECDCGEPPCRLRRYWFITDPTHPRHARRIALTVLNMVRIGKPASAYYRPPGGLAEPARPSMRDFCQYQERPTNIKELE